MNILMLSVLLILFFLTYHMFKKDILSPSVISIGMFIFSAAILLFYQKKWNFDFRVETVITIIGGIIPLILGEMIARLSFTYLNRNTSRENQKSGCNFKDKLLVKNKWNLLIVLFMSSLLIYKAIYVYRSSGFNGFSANILAAYNLAKNEGSIIIPAQIKIIDLLSSTFGYFYLYLFSYNLVFFKEKIKIYLVPVLLWIITAAFSANRMLYISFIAYAFVVWYIHKNEFVGWSKNIFIKVFKKGVLTLAIFLIVFYYLGYLTGKSTDKNLFDYLALYVSGSLPALDNYISTYSYDFSNFGSNTLMGINSFLKYIGLEGFENYRNLEFTIITSNLRTNVYTVYRRLLHDYGILGMIIIRFLFGYVYTKIYLKIKHRQYKNHHFMILFYGTIFYPIAIQAIDEGFFKSIVTITFLLQTLMFYILFKVLIKKNCKGVDIV